MAASRARLSGRKFIDKKTPTCLPAAAVTANGRNFFVAAKTAAGLTIFLVDEDGRVLSSHVVARDATYVALSGKTLVWSGSAGVAATMDLGTWVRNPEKVLNTVMAVVFAVDVRLPMANAGRNTGGRPGVAAGGGCGTMSGVAVSPVLRSMLSEPIRITPAL